MAELAERLGQLEPTANIDRVRFPGEPELDSIASREREGIPVGLQVFAELNVLAAALDVSPLESIPRNDDHPGENSVTE